MGFVGGQRFFGLLYEQLGDQGNGVWWLNAGIGEGFHASHVTREAEAAREGESRSESCCPHRCVTTGQGGRRPSGNLHF